MHRPPDAHYSFTIPSIHDDTTLDCRIYHPDALSKPTYSDKSVQWKRRGIVMAHPYAPMGGSYDDRVVSIVVEEFLKTGWIVGTFNFRGAHGSKGRTSWSGRPELDDYTSYAAFFVHYMCYIQPIPTADPPSTPEQTPIVPQPANTVHTQSDACPVVILGGYSYGSMILRHLPPVPTILQLFSAPLAGSAAEEILLRARKLADQSNVDWQNIARDEVRARSKTKTGYNTRPSLTIGGEETSPDKRRSSREVRRSMDGGGRLEIKTRLRSLSHRRRENTSPHVQPDTTKTATINIPPEIRYLLLSPLTPPISTLAAPALGYKFWAKPREGHHDVIAKHTTLAVFGDQDVFTSVKRIRDWAAQLQAESGSRFTGVEVAGAGHFWLASHVEQTLRTTLREWGS
ncbi:hypothetical protein BDW02DRAFT_488267 [Decorospora gaudefroyi]|uniref:Alpha/beta-hydrolase n=1 Tax=Decorospora gaudefroyi TaxID=184978 RepID=A0A6A5KU55_9PLEO|nr:hypothetical protein BDW02DRAFT_488267 [Decorospora gaudefroyi]